MASTWLTDTLALIATVSTGAAADQATIAAVAQLNTRMNAQDVSDAEFQQAITALVSKLAASTPAAGSAPVVTAISPANGSINGGETITLTGTGFTGATIVNFGTVAGTNLVVASDTSITVTSPAQPAASVDVTVVTPAGTSAVVPADKYTLA